MEINKPSGLLNFDGGICDVEREDQRRAVVLLGKFMEGEPSEEG